MCRCQVAESLYWRVYNIPHDSYQLQHFELFLSLRKKFSERERLSTGLESSSSSNLDCHFEKCASAELVIEAILNDDIIVVMMKHVLPRQSYQNSKYDK